MRNLELVKWVAFLLMIIDHVPKVYGYQLPLAEIIGRGAFPLFAYVWGSSQLKKRSFDWWLLLAAVCAQLSYVAVFDNGKLNILFMFIAAGGLTQWVYYRNYTLGLLFVPFVFVVEYGVLGFLLCLMAAHAHKFGNLFWWRVSAFIVNLPTHWILGVSGWLFTFIIGLNWQIKRIPQIGIKLYVLHLIILYAILQLIQLTAGT